MKLIRTDGGGTFHNPDRLLRVKTTLKPFTETYNKILLLEDHKGTLEVYWLYDPTHFEKILLNEIWLSENELLLKHFKVVSELIEDVML